MAASVAGVFEENLQAKITSSKILVVGAGGIGCEVLKNLVLCGFKDIEIIDLDTIDVSNLNRQFLFHKEHVGKSKAEVARQSALSFNPNVEIKTYHDSIFSTDYGVGFFKRFNVVLNALDNRAARNHVNRMCLTSNVPLLESGTAGYNGQVELIKKGETECYECTEKPRQKSFPGCTIRNTPSEPIHCIVWAKHLFNQLFGECNEDEDVSPDTADPEATSDAGASALSTEATKEGGIERVSTRKWAQINDYSPEKLFNKMFHDDIKYLLSMANLWTTRQGPLPIKWGEFPEPTEAPTTLSHEQKIWSMSECAEVFASSLASIKEEFTKLPADDHLVWDKDDKHAMDFVAACANIRSQIFNIPKKSRFEVKSMAGNIIPAIATTNAITAGIVVMQAFRVLKEEFQKCRSVYVRLVLNGRNQLFVPDKNLVPPNPKCMVCSPKPEIVLMIDTKNVTVKYLRDDILIKALNMVNPDVIHTSKGTIVISSEEGETDCNNDKKLVDLSIADGCVLEVDDFFQNYNLSVTILHKDIGREDSSPFEVIADASVLQPQAENGSEVAPKNGNTEDGIPAQPENNDENQHRIDVDDDDCIEVMEDENAATGEPGSPPSAADSAAGGSSSIKSPPKKRKTESTEPPTAKRSKTEGDSDDDLILVEDD